MKTRQLITLVIALGGALGAEKLLLADAAHGALWWAHIPGFFPVFGFVVCLALAFFAKGLGKHWLQRGERYYERERPPHE